MTYSGLIQDPNAGLSPRGPFPARLTVFTLLSFCLGWAFTTYMPELGDFGWRIAAGLGMAIALVFLVTTVSYMRGPRMLGAVFVSAAFVVGMWGLWLLAQFGGMPSLDQFRSYFSGMAYSVTAFGQPFEIRGYAFELWVGVTALFASIPFLASLARPSAGVTRHNPFDVHPDFADPFMPKLFLLAAATFIIAGAAVYAFPYVVEYELPLQIVLIPPLLAGAIFAKLNMSFVKAMIIAIVGGITGAVGFWVPWYYMTFGKEQTIAFLSDTPQNMLTEVQSMAQGYGYVSDTFGSTIDFTPWTFEIWAGLTLAYLTLPVIVTIGRRLFYLLRIG